MKKLVETHKDPFANPEFFPTFSKFIEQRKEEPEELLPFRQTRNDTQANPGGFKFSFHGYLLTGNPDKAKEKCKQLYPEILTALEEALTQRLDCIIENPLYKSVAALLDTRSYQYTDFDDIYNHVNKIKEVFEVQLSGNNCGITKSKSEAEIAFNHVVNFASTKLSNKIWPMLFPLNMSLASKTFYI